MNDRTKTVCCDCVGSCKDNIKTDGVITNLHIPVLSLTVSPTIGQVKLNRAVGFDCNQVSSIGHKVFGISSTKSDNGEDFLITVIGKAVVEVGGHPINVGDSLITDVEGRAVPSDTNYYPNYGVNVFGYALESSKGVGSLIDVLLR